MIRPIGNRKSRVDQLHTNTASQQAGITTTVTHAPGKVFPLDLVGERVLDARDGGAYLPELVADGGQRAHDLFVVCLRQHLNNVDDFRQEVGLSLARVAYTNVCNICWRSPHYLIIIRYGTDGLVGFTFLFHID